MKKFDVFELPDKSYRAIKYGFNWPSFFFAWIWCFFVARLYGWGCVWIGAWFVGAVLGKIEHDLTISDPSAALWLIFFHIAATLGFGIYFSFNANEFRKRKYTQMGYQLVRKLVDAQNRDNAISIARQNNKRTEASRAHHKTSPAEAFIASAPTPSPDSQSVPTAERFLASASVVVNHKNESAPEINNPTEIDDGWSEEFQILNEYDPVVKECHDELEGLDSQLSSLFREEVVSDRKKATDIRDRLKADYEKKMKPYASEGLNKALAEAKLLGTSAEEEFTQVIKVMGEDADADKIIGRLKEKYESDDLAERIRNLSIKKLDDEELVMVIEGMGIDKLGLNEQNRLAGIKIILPDRKLNWTERGFLEQMHYVLFKAEKERRETGKGISYQGYQILKTSDSSYEIHELGVKLKGSGTYESIQSAKSYIDRISD